MKRSLWKWKVWTILPILTFVMTLWVVVYAATGVFSGYKITTTHQKIEMSEWNEIMDKLGKLKESSRLWPEWMVAAFVDVEECPTWWTRYDAADWKFLMWTNVTSKIWKTEWNANNLVTIGINNMPPHKHWIADILGKVFIDSFEAWYYAYASLWTDPVYSNSDYVNILNWEYIDVYKSNFHAIDGTADSEGYCDWYTPTWPADEGGNHCSYVPYIKHSTYAAGGSSPIDVTNSNIKVLFCKKNLYN